MQLSYADFFSRNQMVFSKYYKLLAKLRQQFNIRIFDIINRTDFLYMIYYNFLYHVGAFGGALPKWEQLEFRVKYKISGMSSVGT